MFICMLDGGSLTQACGKQKMTLQGSAWDSGRNVPPLPQTSFLLHWFCISINLFRHEWWEEAIHGYPNTCWFLWNVSFAIFLNLKNHTTRYSHNIHTNLLVQEVRAHNFQPINHTPSPLPHRRCIFATQAIRWKTSLPNVQVRDQFFFFCVYGSLRFNTKICTE